MPRDGGPVGDLLGGLPFNRGPSMAATFAEQPMPCTDALQPAMLGSWCWQDPSLGSAHWLAI